MINNWNNSAYTLSIYKNQISQLAILEALLMHNKMHLNKLQFIIAERMKGNYIMMWKVTNIYILDRTVYLEKLGLLSIKNDTIEITQQGIDALKNAEFHNMAYTSFFNYKTLYFARWALIASIFSLIASIIAIFFPLIIKTK